MRWILLWTIVTVAGGVSSGSEPFEGLDACYAGQKAMGSISGDASDEMGRRSSIESVCINSATGERKTIIAPRK